MKFYGYLIIVLTICVMAAALYYEVLLIQVLRQVAAGSASLRVELRSRQDDKE